jgi:hypothetical protein
MVYTAVANVLKSRIVDAQVKTRLTGVPEPIVGFGDLVVLANPAFEASLYQPFQELIDRSLPFAPTQRPVLVILASETDTTTRVFFKLGRTLATVFQRTGPRSPRPMLVTTVGNYDPFVTHHATTSVEARGEQPLLMLGTVANCQCSLPMTDLSTESVHNIVELLRAGPGGAPALQPPQPCPGIERMDTVELSCAAPRPLPLWVIRASNDVISGHSGFFTRPVSDIVRGLVARTLLQELAASPKPRN